MKNRLIIISVLLSILVACSSADKKEIAGQAVPNNTIINETSLKQSNDIDLIKSVYGSFVFAIDVEGDDIQHPEKFFTSHALKKLSEDYKFDCEDGTCYAYYALRTDAQDSKPGSEEESTVIDIEPAGDGWYIASYLDMGWPGKTRIKVTEGKIDDYERQTYHKE